MSKLLIYKAGHVADYADVNLTTQRGAAKSLIFMAGHVAGSKLSRSNQ